MLVRAPLVEAEQDGSIRIQDLTKIVMARSRLGLAEERLIPFEAAGHVPYADDRPCAFHRVSAVGLTRTEQTGILRDGRDNPRRPMNWEGHEANSKATAGAVARSNILHRTSNISFG